MIALLFLAAQIAPEADIVVVAQRLDALEVHVGKDVAGRYSCGLSQSSGSLKLDKRLCKASAACARKHGAQPEQVKACVTETKPRLLAQLRAERAR